MSQYGTFSNDDMQNYIESLQTKKAQRATMGEFAYQDNVDYSAPVWDNFLKGREAMDPVMKQKMIDNRLSDNYRISQLIKYDPKFKDVLKTTNLRKQLAKKLQYEKMQRKLLSMSPAERKQYFLARLNSSRGRAQLHKIWEKNFLADLPDDYKALYFKDLHKSPSYVNSLAGTKDNRNKLVSGYNSWQIPLWYKGHDSPFTKKYKYKKPSRKRNDYAGDIEEVLSQMKGYGAGSIDQETLNAYKAAQKVKQAEFLERRRRMRAGHQFVPEYSKEGGNDDTFSVNQGDRVLLTKSNPQIKDTIW